MFEYIVKLTFNLYFCRNLKRLIYGYFNKGNAGWHSGF